MKRKAIGLLIFFFILFLPSFIWAGNEETIIILVDELSFDIIEDLSLEKYSIGLVNYKTRPPYNKENLLLSINTGRKLSLRDFKNKSAKIEYLGDVLEDEKVSYIGGETEKLLIANSEGQVDYEAGETKYDFNWLLDNTQDLLQHSNILLISYDINGHDERIDILKKYLSYFGDRNIIILPEKVADEKGSLLNRFIVPIVYINGTDSGILTSQSTKRDGFIALEDISVQIKNIYGIDYKKDVGKPIEIVRVDSPLEIIKGIYTTSINLLVITTIFHGLIYSIQVFVGIGLLKYKEIHNWAYGLYCTLIGSIPISIILGLFNLHKNIPLYIVTCIFLSYGMIKAINKGKLNLVKTLSLLTYALIVLGTLFYPKTIYNSYIGFNNLFYGARYYGLNNGIMGVLLISSILSYFSSIKGIKKEGLKKVLGLFIFSLNILVLSVRFGANTGGFITSVVLFGLILFQIFSLNKNSIFKSLIFLLLGAGIFAINMLLDYNSISKSHAIEFLYRIKNNGLWEFMTIASFKAKELLKLTIIPPFSIVIVFQILILRKMRGLIRDKIHLRNKDIIVLITAIVGFLLNDTGSITFIYMIFFYILDLIYETNTDIKGINFK